MRRKEDGSCLEQRHIKSLLEDYVALINTPANLLNGIDSYLYKSDSTTVGDRERALSAFITSPNSSKIIAVWGETIFAEIWAFILATVAYPKFSPTAGSLRFRLVPTDLDETRDYKRDETVPPLKHQKGADLLLFEKREKGDYPLLLIDVTLGNPSTLKHKRGRLLLQAETETPVVVLGLKDLHVLSLKNNVVGNFPRFLRLSCADIRAGKNAAYILERYTDPKWPSDLKGKMLSCIDITERNLSTLDNAYPDRIGVALTKLKRAREILS